MVRMKTTASKLGSDPNRIKEIIASKNTTSTSTRVLRTASNRKRLELERQKQIENEEDNGARDGDERSEEDEDNGGGSGDNDIEEDDSGDADKDEESAEEEHEGETCTDEENEEEEDVDEVIEEETSKRKKNTKSKKKATKDSESEDQPSESEVQPALLIGYENHIAHKIWNSKVIRILSSPTFWGHVELAIRIFEPLVKVLRRADGDIPSMGWLYGDLENAKNEIAEALNHKKKKYLAIWAIIDKRWDNKLKNELHLTGYFLNQSHYYGKREEIENKHDFMDGFTSCLFKMYKNDYVAQDNITKQLCIYQNQEGNFGTLHAIRQRNNPSFNPVTWWKMHGGSAPDLRKMAIRILGLTTNSSGCERAWSAFEMVHTKKRNRLNPDKLRDLVFVKFNSQLKAKLGASTRDALAAPNKHEGVFHEWIGGSKKSYVGGALSDNETDDEVFPGEGLTWKEVSKAMGNEVYERPKRAKKRVKTYHRRSSSRKGKELLVLDEAAELDSHEDTSSSSESDSEFADD